MATDRLVNIMRVYFEDDLCPKAVEEISEAAELMVDVKTASVLEF